MVAILRVPGVMFQQRREEQSCIVQTESATVETCQPALEDRRRPPSVISGAISGAGSGLGAGCTGFTVGNPPVDGENDTPDAEGGDDAVEPEDVTELVDVDGDGEPDEVADDGETPEVHDDGEIFDFEDGEVEEDAEVEEDGETADFCVNSPTISSATSPVDGAPDIPLTPTLDWDANDLDAGDTLTYRVRLWRTDDPSIALVDETVSDSQYTIPAGILANNENYSWQIDAWDTCSPTANLISSPVWHFTTEPACAPYSITDPTDYSLPEDPTAWSFQYEGTALPETPLSLVGSFVAPTPISDGDNLSISTLGSNQQGYYRMDTARDNAIGSVTDVRVRVNGEDDNTPPLSSPGLMLTVIDGSRSLDIAIHADQVCESARAGICVPTPDPTVPHIIRLSIRGNDYQLYRDGTRIIDGTGLLASATATGNIVAFGDEAAGPDISAEVDYVRTFDLGDHLPVISPYSYEAAPQDTGIAANGHEGAIINWSPASAPGTVSIAVRAADSLADLATAPWSAELTDNPATIPAGVIGRYLQWRITLTAPAAPTTPPIIDEVSVSQTCP